ncbi:ammonium transporter, Amt family [Acidiphilium sp. MT5]
MRRVGLAGAMALPLISFVLPAKAAETGLNSGDTAWMLVSSVLVLLMTIPGLVLFYGGMVRKKNVLSIMMQSVTICALVSLLWVVVGYSLAFSNGNGFVGDLSDMMLRGLAQNWQSAFVLGAISGAVAGLVAITPAAGFVLPGAAMVIGVAAGLLSYWVVTMVKPKLGFDDTLDAFGVHGVAGILGTLATGLLAFAPLSDGAVRGGLHQLLIQAIGVGATALYCGAVTGAILFFLEPDDGGLRVSRDEERQGLDEVLHGESMA